jgi:hypothetical protein
MDYKCEVAIAITRSFFSKVMEIAPDATKQMVEWADSFEEKDDAVMLYWHKFNWYAGSPGPCGDFYRAIRKVRETEIDGYYLIELGSDHDDNNIEGAFQENPWNLTFSRSITWKSQPLKDKVGS